MTLFKIAKKVQAEKKARKPSLLEASRARYKAARDKAKADKAAKTPAKAS